MEKDPESQAPTSTCFDRPGPRFPTLSSQSVTTTSPKVQSEESLKLPFPGLLKVLGYQIQPDEPKRPILAIGIWYLFNISTLLLNKYLYQMLHFLFPWTLTCIHMAFCFGLGYLALHVFKWHPHQFVKPSDRIKRILPLSLLFAINIILGNVSLRWIPVSFMQTVKSGVPFFTVLLQTLYNKKIFDQRIYFSLIPIVGGVGLASWTEVNFEMIGFLCALIACVTTAIQAIISGILLSDGFESVHPITKVVEKTKLDSINLTYNMSLFALIVLTPFALIIEGPSLIQWNYFGTFFSLIVLSISGTVAFFLNGASFFAISSTSPLTFTVAGNLKVVLSVTLSVIIFGNEISLINGIGCMVAVAGVWWYNLIRVELMMVEKKSKE